MKMIQSPEHHANMITVVLGQQERSQWVASYLRGTVVEQVKAAVRAAVEAKLIGGALSLRGMTAMDQAEAILAAIDAVEVP